MKLKFTGGIIFGKKINFIYFHLHQPCRNEIVLREKCGDNFNDARISSAINSSKIGASAVVVKTTVAKENEPRSRSFCAKSFNGVLIVQPPLHIDRGTHGIVDHRPSNSLVKRFLCIPSTLRCFPLTSILSPIPLSGNNRETFDSLIKTSRSIQRSLFRSTFSFQLLPFATRISSLVRSLIHSLCIPPSLGDAC